MRNLIPSNAVIQSGNQLRTDSRVVAKSFHKHHYHVMAKIEALTCSEHFLTHNFSLVTYLHNGNTYTYCEMTKDGFMFLVMGFTGAQAAAIKEAFISVFNAMTEALTTLQIPDELATFILGERRRYGQS